MTKKINGKVTSPLMSQKFTRRFYTYYYTLHFTYLATIGSSRHYLHRCHGTSSGWH